MRYPLDYLCCTTLRNSIARVQLTASLKSVQNQCHQVFCDNLVHWFREGIKLFHIVSTQNVSNNSMETAINPL